MDEGGETPLDLVAGPLAWLESWAVHVGSCLGGAYCTCGLTLARYELESASIALARQNENRSA